MSTLTRKKCNKKFGWEVRRNNFEDPSRDERMIIALYSTPAQSMAHGQHTARATVISCPRRHLK